MLCLGESAGLIGETNLFPAGVGPNDPPNFCGKEKTVTGADGVERIYNVSIPTITPFLVSNSTSRSAVVVAPGGGYSFLAWNIEGTLIAKKFNDDRVNVFVLKYRVPAGHLRKVCQSGGLLCRTHNEQCLGLEQTAKNLI